MISILYHSRDLDGFTSGAIAKYKFPEAALIGYDYGQDFPWHLIAEGSDVLMVDVSLPMADMFRLAQHAGSFTWIDHHASAIYDYNSSLPYFDSPKMRINAVLEDGISACEGTWRHLFPGEPIPEPIKLLGEYDTWRNADRVRWENEILPFQFGMRMLCSSPETFPMIDVVLSPGALVDDIIASGKTILAYQREQYKTMCKKAFAGTFAGLRVICLNGVGSSDAFASVWDEEKHDAMLAFTYTGKLWTVSLYTTKDSVDCSAIAKANGGGGHKKAAGFQVDNIDKFIIGIKHTNWIKDIPCYKSV